MFMSAPCGAIRLPSVLCLLVLAGCAATAESAYEEAEAYLLAEELAPGPAPPSGEVLPQESPEVEGEARLAVAGPEAGGLPLQELAQIIVEGKPPGRDEMIRTLVLEAEQMLRDVPLEYIFTGKGRKETLRGRPVVFALWSESQLEWTLAHLE